LKYDNVDTLQEIDASDIKDLPPIVPLEDIKVSLVPSIMTSTTTSTINREKEFSDNSTSSIPERTSPTGNLSDAASKGHSSSDASLSSNLSAIVGGGMSSDLASMSLSKKTSDVVEQLNIEKPNLASFLILRACENITLANYFYW
jgi:hypothetical protein